MRAPEFWNHKHGSLAAPLTRSLLTPLSWLMVLAGRARQRRVTPVHAPVPVICLGNVTLGGTGKTPLAIALAACLHEKTQSPFFLSRGYGGKLRGPVIVDPVRHSALDVGDEALLLAKAAPTIVAHDRVAGAQLAAAKGASLIIMDDGFQNPHLAKDVSFLVMDAHGLGNGRVFPAGPLREPVDDALARANAIIFMGDGKMNISTDLPVLRAALINPETPPSGPLLAFAGIGRPQKFFAALRAHGADLVQEISFADHHAFRATEITRLQSWAAAENATLVTTQKDYERLPVPLRENIFAWPVEAHFLDQDALMALITPVLKRGVL
ncbi:MAG: tetraacyldisaccharide 4'-kinase [Robiginitomaculum sp.]|nr:MAG: tetraacyldisaccharide 4'-kinase [Robiginitomaculum sp.]